MTREGRVMNKQSTSETATSATEKKFAYMQLLRETAIPGDDEAEEATEETTNFRSMRGSVVSRTIPEQLAAWK